MNQSDQPIPFSQIDRRQAVKALLAGACGTLGVCGCQSAPITGRKQLIVMSQSEEMSLGDQAYKETLQSEKISTNTTMAQMVQRVGERIARVSGNSEFNWEFNLIASDQQNAFCLPGGKVAIYEGIMPICKNEAGLAVVMGHEVAHALARHGAERMSQQMASNGLKQVASIATKEYVPEKSELLMQVYGVGSEYLVILPYSRKHESEADHIGALMMADAGYDPTEAPRFWSRFGGLKSENQTPEFLSTHPSDARRAGDLRKLMPEAKAKYNRVAEKYGFGESIV